MQLDQCWKQKPYLDGGKLIKELGISKGPLVGNVMSEQIKFMLRYQPPSPSGQTEQKGRNQGADEKSRIQECIEYLKVYLESLK